MNELKEALKLVRQAMAANPDYRIDLAEAALVDAVNATTPPSPETDYLSRLMAQVSE